MNTSQWLLIGRQASVMERRDLESDGASQKEEQV
jgi:hypothetical protein